MRKKVFGAALEQSEQLLTAARSVGPQARPLLLFYGLSQSARAISAAATTVSNDAYNLRGHGITARNLDLASTGLIGNLATIDHGDGAFLQVSRFLRCASHTSLTPLAQTWSLLPDLAAFPIAGLSGPKPLSVNKSSKASQLSVESIEISGVSREAFGEIHVHGNVNHPYVRSTDGVRAFLSQYPSIADWDFVPSDLDGMIRVSMSDRGDIGSVQIYATDPDFGNARVLIDHICLPYPGFGSCVFPTTGGSELAAHPFMAWWAILYTLSMLARYHPVEWSKCIDLEASQDAAPIESALTRAMQIFPTLVYDTLRQVASE